jgi:hypothetical protein
MEPMSHVQNGQRAGQAGHSTLELAMADLASGSFMNEFAA